jgi:hypothetical protein
MVSFSFFLSFRRRFRSESWEAWSFAVNMDAGCVRLRPRILTGVNAGSIGSYGGMRHQAAVIGVVGMQRA